MTDMANWLRLWIPFSSEGKKEKYETKKQLNHAHQMYEDSLFKKKDYERLYEQQKELAEKLRRESRKNNFNQMFQLIPPRIEKEED